MIVKEKGVISKEKFCKICRISKNTAYKLIEFERIKAIKRNCGSSYYYEIPVIDKTFVLLGQVVERYAS